MRYDQMSEVLETLRDKHNLRVLPTFQHQGKYACEEGRSMLNLSSNDYLGLSTQNYLREEFMQHLRPEDMQWSASSSRLLTGNFEAHRNLEAQLARLFHKEAALVFNSGFHANSGIVAALADKGTLILADKLVHASLIDGIRLSGSTCIRYRHNQYEQLENLLEQRCHQYESVLIITESVFSMDGDKADLRRLCQLKKRYPHVMLYVDEAHAFGVFGPTGLGCAEEQHCLEDIDILVGTFGKAIASEGAFVVCNQVVKDYLINTMRPFIFTTALPPINIEWTSFIVSRLESFGAYRSHLASISLKLKTALSEMGYDTSSESAILPFTVGDSGKCILLAKELQRKGFYALPVRPPTVPEGTSRIRFSLSAAVTDEEIQSLIHTLNEIL